MRKVDARGDACPLPVVKAKKAIAELNGAGEVEVLVDNEIAVQNLTKMAQQKGYQSAAEKLAEREYRVLFTVGEPAAEEEEEAVEEAPAPAAPVAPVAAAPTAGLTAQCQHTATRWRLRPVCGFPPVQVFSFCSFLSSHAGQVFSGSVKSARYSEFPLKHTHV